MRFISSRSHPPPPLIFHDVSSHPFLQPPHCPPCKVNDFNLVTLGALDKLGGLDWGGGERGAKAAISANGASGSFSEKEYS